MKNFNWIILFILFGISYFLVKSEYEIKTMIFWVVIILFNIWNTIIDIQEDNKKK